MEEIEADVVAEDETTTTITTATIMATMVDTMVATTMVDVAPQLPLDTIIIVGRVEHAGIQVHNALLLFMDINHKPHFAIA